MRHSMRAQVPAFLAMLILAMKIEGSLGNYYGIFIGAVQGFPGKVYAVNDKQVYITELDLEFDFEASFCIGKDIQPNPGSTKIPDDYGKNGSLRAYQDARVLLTFPSEIKDYNYLGVCSACERLFMTVCFKQGFKSVGYVTIPDDFKLPAEQNIGVLSGEHANAPEVILLDSATIQLTEFNYDGQVPDAYFAVEPRESTVQANVTRLDGENGTKGALQAYSNKNVTLYLPDGHHWNEYRSFIVHSFATNGTFAHVNISREVAEKLPVHRPTSDAPTILLHIHWILQVVIFSVAVSLLVFGGSRLILLLRPYPPRADVPAALFNFPPLEGLAQRDTRGQTSSMDGTTSHQSLIHGWKSSKLKSTTTTSTTSTSRVAS